MQKIFIYIAASLLFSSCANAQDQEHKQLFEQLQTLVKNDNADALYHVGMMYHWGLGTEKDTLKAKYNFQKASALGQPLAAYKLGCYYDGQGGGVVKRDLVQALKHKLVAAKAGYALAQSDVAKIYYDEGKFSNALEYLMLAVNQGNRDSIMAMASIHNSESGIEKNPAITVAYFSILLDISNGGSKEQQNWLSKFNEKLTEDEKAKRDNIIRNWRPKPNRITIDGLSGLRAAQKLVTSAAHD